jgi:two-component system chemotaxis response regulator CheB
VLVVRFLEERAEAYARALAEAGAAGIVTKADAGSFAAMAGELCERIEAIASREKWKTKHRDLAAEKPSRFEVIGVGASTGGVEALRYILEQLPAAVPGVVVAQHGPPWLAARLAESLDRTCALKVTEAKAGDRVAPGRVLIAPCDRNVELRRSGGGLCVELKPCARRPLPSIDALFNSMASSAGPRAIGLLLSGMGDDGAEGMLAMRRAGALTLAQDEATSLVFGMPRAACERGGVEYLVSLDAIPGILGNVWR